MTKKLIGEARLTWREITDSDNGESPLMRMIRELCDALENPVPMIIWCPKCHERHIDKGVYAVNPHHSHACQHCGHVWRPAIIATVGVQFLPGFKDEEE
jgi:hypothetical protein